MTDAGHVYRWRKWLPEYYGQRCRLIASGTMNSALVEFLDGVRHVISRNALRKVKCTCGGGFRGTHSAYCPLSGPAVGLPEKNV